MVFFCSKKIKEQDVIAHFKQFTNMALSSLAYPDSEAELFLMFDEYAGNFPVGGVIGFPKDWCHDVDAKGFCTYLAQACDCMTLLDVKSEAGIYWRSKPSGECAAVTVQIAGECFIFEC